MKKLLFVAFAVVGIAFASCGNQTSGSDSAADTTLAVDSDSVIADSVGVAAE